MTRKGEIIRCPHCNTKLRVNTKAEKNVMSLDYNDRELVAGTLRAVHEMKESQERLLRQLSRDISELKEVVRELRNTSESNSDIEVEALTETMAADDAALQAGIDAAKKSET